RSPCARSSRCSRTISIRVRSARSATPYPPKCGASGRIPKPDTSGNRRPAREVEMDVLERRSEAATAARAIAPACQPLPPLDDIDAFGRAFDRYADARVVLLGEASHGTS